MLAAYDKGLASCRIGLAQGWLATAEGKAATYLPVNDMPIAPIVVGHPKNETASTPRKLPEISWL